MTVLNGCSLIDIDNTNTGETKVALAGDEGEAQNDSAKQDIQNVLNEAQNDMDGEDYVAALEVLESALESYAGDTDLQDLYNRAEAAYVEQVQDKVKEYTGADDYDSALKELSQALEILPNNDDLTSLQKKTEKKKPDRLCDLDVTESNDGYTPVTEQVLSKDTIGNTYSPGNLFLVDPNESNDDGGYAKYYLGEKYSKLNFTLAVSSENPDDKSPSEFTIYGDGDQILFTSEELDRSTEPVVAGVEVKNQKWIYVRATGTEDWGNVAFLFANPVLYR